ncbi:MAG: hypothetical protein OXN97_17470 [Bryobacterales bacterium]|nr:hypothetical protein [Bryobacterales bacterium]
MREITLWRWVFGLALAPTIAWGRLSRDLYPESGFLDLGLSLIPAYIVSLLVVALLAGVALAAHVRVLEAWDFLRDLLGFRREA